MIGRGRHAARQFIAGFALLLFLANASRLVKVHVVQRLAPVRLFERHRASERAFEKVAVVEVVGFEVEVHV